MKIIFFLLIVLLNFCPGSDIKISAYQHSSRYTKLTHKIVDQKIADINRFFDLEKTEINILLFNDHKIFHKLTGLPDHIPGALLSNTNRVFLKTPDLTAMSRQQYENLISHEMIHAIQNQKISLTLFPDWFNEGLAEYFSEDFTIDQKVQLSKFLLHKEPPALDELRIISHKYQQLAIMDYILSASIIEFLLVNYGNDVFKSFFTEMQENKNFYASLFKVTHLTEEQFEFYWHEYLGSKYKNLFLLDVQYIIWLFLPFLFIFSFILKQILNKAIINRWKYERLEEKINDIFTDKFFGSDQSA